MLNEFYWRVFKDNLIVIIHPMKEHQKEMMTLLGKMSQNVRNSAPRSTFIGVIYLYNYLTLRYIFIYNYLTIVAQQ